MIRKKHTETKNTVIIVAGGIGSRMGSKTPKQFMPLAGTPILMRTIAKFAAYDSNLDIIVTLPEDHIEIWKNLCKQYNFEIPHTIVCGGETRFDSVKNALEKVSGLTPIVAIHDGVRPLVSLETIKRCFDIAAEKGNAIPATPVTESIRRIKNGKSEIVDRTGIFIIQTPQTFKYKTIKRAYKQTYRAKFTDDASVVECTRTKLNFVEGNIENVKITLPTDIIYAEKILSETL